MTHTATMAASDRVAARTDTIELRVLALEPVAERVLSVTLGRPQCGSDSDAGDTELPAWNPGSHIDLHLPGGMVRQYSLCSDPADRERWRVAVLLENHGRGGSQAVHERLRVGDTLRASRPLDTFEYRPAASVIFIAGGIGITPLLPMVRAAERDGAHWRLLYLGRRLEVMSFRDELVAYGERVVVHPSDVLGRISLPDALDGLHSDGFDDADIYACGPERMLTDLESWCGDGSRLHVERFVAAGALGEVEIGLAPDSTTDTAFIVETSDGTEIEVGQDESILAAMMRCGIPALNSCQEGICGTCETVVIEGTPDHRDHVLSDEERASNETMMICVSRCAGTRLVLDL